MTVNWRAIAEASGKAADKRPAPTVWYVHESYSLESVEGLTGVRVYEDGRGKELIHYVTAVPLGPDTDPRSLPMTVGGSAGLPEEFGGSGGYANVYSPLKYHDMFLEFATLAEEPITPEVVKEWCETYGTLGAPLLRECSLRGGFMIKGRTDWHQDVAEFARHARTANQVLRLFEAYSDPDGSDAEAMWRHGARDDTPEQIKADAESLVLDTLNGILASEVYPARYRKRGRGYVRGDAFRSLLGALYVQFDRLLDTPEDGLRRCKWWRCDRIIDFEPPDDLRDQGSIRNDRRKGYKKRRDADFCSKKHANDHYYATVTKPKRDAERIRKRVGL